MRGEELKSKFRRLVELREKRDSTKLAAENAEKEYREYEAELWDELDDSPLKGTIKLDLGPPYGEVKFGPRETFYGRVLDKEAALDYFENRALMDEYTEPKIAMSRVNELVRECLEQKRPIPEGLDFYAKRYISISHK
jgi:hypothetical protein